MMRKDYVVLATSLRELYMRGEMSDNAIHRVASDLDAAYANFNYDRFISAAIPD